MKKGLFITQFFCLSVLTANQAFFYNSTGDACSLDIKNPMSVWEIKEELEEIFFYPKEEILLMTEDGFLGEEEEFFPYDCQDVWVFSDSHDKLIPKKTYAGYRDYDRQVTRLKKSDLHFIMKTMATKSITSLLKQKSALETAGDRIDDIHPLRFLETVFTDNELKVYMHNILKRGGWIWGAFINGVKVSLQDEYEIDNLTDDMLVDFSSLVGIDLSKIEGLINRQKWEDFIKTLIVYIPREGESDRYD